MPSLVRFTPALFVQVGMYVTGGVFVVAVILAAVLAVLRPPADRRSRTPLRVVLAVAFLAAALTAVFVLLELSRLARARG